MITILLQIVLATVIVGVVVWGIGAMPAIDETFKAIARVVLIVVWLIFVVIRVATIFGVKLF